MLIIITGVPGTGKTSIASSLSKKLNYLLVSELDFCKNNKLGIMESGELVVDIPDYESSLKSFIKGKDNIVFEGHMLCQVDLDVDFSFVLRTHPKTLFKRLKKRGYSGRKLKDNIESEFLDYCSHVAGKRVFEIDTTGRSVSDCVELISQILDGPLDRGDNVDWSFDMPDYLTKGYD